MKLTPHHTIISLMLALSSTLPGIAQAGSACDWVAQKSENGTLQLGHQSQDSELHYYGAAFNSDDFDFVLKESYAAVGEKLRGTAKDGEYLLPAGTDKVVLVCSTKKLKEWDSRHLSLSVPFAEKDPSGKLTVESLGGSRNMSNEHGTPTEKGNDIASYSSVTITDE